VTAYGHAARSEAARLHGAACYLPCDPGYPDDRLAIYLEDAHASVLLTEPEHRQRAGGLVGAGCPVLDIGEASARSSAASALAAGLAQPEDPAYIIFTSGSTGRPKGCMLPHRGLQDLLPWLVDLHRLGAPCGQSGACCCNGSQSVCR